MLKVDLKMDLVEAEKKFREMLSSFSGQIEGMLNKAKDTIGSLINDAKTGYGGMKDTYNKGKKYN